MLQEKKSAGKNCEVQVQTPQGAYSLKANTCLGWVMQICTRDHGLRELKYKVFCFTLLWYSNASLVVYPN